MTAPGNAEAEAVVRTLVEERLIACGNIIPGAVSIYRWEGEVHRDAESVVVLKTVRRLLPTMLERAGQLHPYDVPELLVHDVVDGAGAYLEWVRRECRAKTGTQG
jgi:periplasmic divalent cation tolerance protein